ncbi:MAG: shikimate dehydrogenase [Pseudomonadota bacterium]
MKVYGVISDRRAFNSKSPAMHTAVLHKLRLSGVYLPFAVEPHHIGDAVRGLKALGVAGVNVTVPHKQAVMPFLDFLSEEAAAIGAVNTIVNRGNLLEGHNTDAAGFSDSLTQAGFEAAGKTAVVIGNGGAARAVIFALKKLGASDIILAGRNQDKVEETAQELNVTPSLLDALQHRTFPVHLMVNAASVSSPAESPELAAWAAGLKLPECRLVFDLNYGRPQNFWHALAERRQVPFLGGLVMLAHQAKHSFELWTGLNVEAAEFLAGLGDGR